MSADDVVVLISLQRELKRRETEYKKLKAKGIEDPQKELIIESLKNKLDDIR